MGIKNLESQSGVTGVTVFAKNSNRNKLSIMKIFTRHKENCSTSRRCTEVGPEETARALSGVSRGDSHSGPHVNRRSDSLRLLAKLGGLGEGSWRPCKGLVAGMR